MGLQNALEDATDGNLWRSLCGVHRAMEDHPGEADVIFEFCTHRHDKTAASVARTLRGHGIRVGDQMITRHRADKCLCRQRIPERYDA